MFNQQSTIINAGGGVGVVQHGTDNSVFVEFYQHALKDEEASASEGRPIFRDVDFIRISIPGDRNTVVERPVDLNGSGSMPADPERWPRQWEAYKNQSKQVLDGTPITEWPPLTKAQATELKALNIHTVEALASVNDSNLAALGMGGRALREKAQAFIENASGDNAAISRLAEENKDLKLQIQALQEQIKQIGATQVAAKSADGKSEGEIEAARQKAIANAAPAKAGRPKLSLEQ